MDNEIIEKYKKAMVQMYGERGRSEVQNGETGLLSAAVTAVAGIYPVSGARVTVFTGSPENMTVLESDITDNSGKTRQFRLSAPARELSMSAEATAAPYTLYNLLVSADGFLDNIHLNIPIFSGVVSVQKSDLLPKSVAGGRTEPIIFNEYSSFEL